MRKILIIQRQSSPGPGTAGQGLAHPESNLQVLSFRKSSVFCPLIQSICDRGHWARLSGVHPHEIQTTKFLYLNHSWVTSEPHPDDLGFTISLHRSMLLFWLNQACKGFCIEVQGQHSGCGLEVCMAIDA